MAHFALLGLLRPFCVGGLCLGYVLAERRVANPAMSEPNLAPKGHTSSRARYISSGSARHKKDPAAVAMVLLSSVVVFEITESPLPTMFVFVCLL